MIKKVSVQVKIETNETDELRSPWSSIYQSLSYINKCNWLNDAEFITLLASKIYFILIHWP